ncbi:MAG: hypothetical protein IKS35_07415 [Clostridia bacterium]|nr:hypothetical protein [Clostridia bacterium]
MEPNQEPNSPPGKQRDRAVVIRILKIAGFTVGAIVIVYLILILAEHLVQNRSKQPARETETYYFYPADYEEDISQDQVYMGLDRSVYYTIPNMGTTESLDNENLPQHDGYVNFLYQMIQFIISGDRDGYQSCLSQNCLSEMKISEIPEFTAQKLYNIEITEYRTDEENSRVYILEYMIYRNNGTFRQDIGSNSSRKQYLTVILTDGTYKIDSIVNYTTTGR